MLTRVIQIQDIRAFIAAASYQMDIFQLPDLFVSLNIWGSCLEFKIQMCDSAHYLAGRDHYVEIDAPVRKVKEVKVVNHKILTFYCLYLWS